MGEIQTKNIKNYDNIARLNNCVKINFNDDKSYDAVKNILTFCDIVFTALDKEKTLFVDKGLMDDSNLGYLIEM